jgi:esterase FrsA
MSHIRSIDEIKAEVRQMAGKSKIFRRAKIEDIESVLSNLTSKDPELWAAEWSRIAKPYEDAGVGHERAGRLEAARAAYLQAYVYYATGRYPVPHSPGKMDCFRKSLELYEKAGRYFEPSLSRVEIPYGDKVVPAYLRL